MKIETQKFLACPTAELSIDPRCLSSLTSTAIKQKMGQTVKIYIYKIESLKIEQTLQRSDQFLSIEKDSDSNF